MVPWFKYERHERYDKPRHNPSVTVLLMLATACLACWLGRAVGVSPWLFIPVASCLSGIVVVRRTE